MKILNGMLKYEHHVCMIKKINIEFFPYFFWQKPSFYHLILKWNLIENKNNIKWLRLEYAWANIVLTLLFTLMQISELAFYVMHR